MTRISKNAVLSSSDTNRSAAVRLGSRLGEFSTLCIDDDPTLLAEAYRLRYRVYCIERAFLRASDYPDGLETDEFDRYATHLGTVDSAGRMIGTVRLVSPSVLGLPLFRHCSTFPGEEELYDPGNRVVEISRLSVRQHRLEVGGNHHRDRRTHTDDVRTRDDAVIFSLYRGIYHFSKRTGLTHWAIAAEASLRRSVASYRIPFRMIGPKVDYSGPVAPYLAQVSVYDRIVVGGTVPKLDGFLDGLEETYSPRPSEPQPHPRTSNVWKPLDLDVD